MVESYLIYLQFIIKALVIMASVFLSLGSNLGDRKKSLEKAISLIEADIGAVLQRSDFIETEPWGFGSKKRFLNMVICLNTLLRPEDLLYSLKKIESTMGRGESKGGYHDRPIDVDIIFYDDLVISTTELIIPHPLMEKREFVLEPLNQIAPDFIHPVLKESVQSLLNKLA